MIDKTRAVADLKAASQFLAPAAPALWIGWYLQSNVFSQPVIFGGTVCETTGNIQGCFGFPPTGIVVLLLASYIVVGLAMHSYARLSNT